LKSDEFLHPEQSGEWDEVLRDLDHALDSLSSGALSEYQGNHVAFLRGAIVGFGPDSELLRRVTSQQQRVHPERLALVYVEPEISVVGIHATGRTSP
jgi:hypothetical protein